MLKKISQRLAQGTALVKHHRQGFSLYWRLMCHSDNVFIVVLIMIKKFTVALTQLFRLLLAMDGMLLTVSPAVESKHSSLDMSGFVSVLGSRQ
jgi:hypothetical protein